MSSNVLADRGRSLEDAFFANQDAASRRRLAEAEESKSKAEALSDASGITDPSVLDRLVGWGLSGTTLVALALAPLVIVAWSDGGVDERERQVLLDSAVKAGLTPTHQGYGLFESWLKTKPRPDLLATWKAYTAAMPAEARAALRPQLMEHARAVAEAAGGVLGFGKITAAEQVALDELSVALSD